MVWTWCALDGLFPNLVQPLVVIVPQVEKHLKTICQRPRSHRQKKIDFGILGCRYRVCLLPLATVHSGWWMLLHSYSSICRKRFFVYYTDIAFIWNKSVVKVWGHDCFILCMRYFGSSLYYSLNLTEKRGHVFSIFIRLCTICANVISNSYYISHYRLSYPSKCTK